MPRLPDTLAALGSADFPQVLKRELETLRDGDLPLQAGLAQSSSVGTQSPQVMVLSVDEQARPVRARVGVFYSGVIAGCNCADDPTPVEEQAEYCELWVDLDADTGTARIALCGDV